MASNVLRTMEANVSKWTLLTLLWIGTLVRLSMMQQTTTGAATPDVLTLISLLGILPPLQDEQTTSILRNISDDQFIFEVVNISAPEKQTLQSYADAVDEVRRAQVAALVGPYHPQYSVACRHLNVPYLVTSQLPEDVVPGPLLVELFPNAVTFGKSVRDVISFYHYTKVAVVYDSWAGAAVLEQLLMQSSMEVTAYRVQQKGLKLVRGALKAMRDQYFDVYVCVLSPDTTNYVMNQALALSMFSPTYKWILVNTHLDEFGLEKYVDTRANITVLRLMMDFHSQLCQLQAGDISLKRAVLHDAVQVFRFQTMNRHGEVRCQMKQTNKELRVDGCTGCLEFDSFGRRQESFLQIMSLQGYRKGEVTDEEVEFWGKQRKVKGQAIAKETLRRQLSGTWRSSPLDLMRRVVPSKSYSYVTRQQVFGEEPLRITTLIEPPFVQYRGDTKGWREPGIIEATTGKELEGMCLDILKEMSLLLGFTFNVSLVPDGKYGSLKPTGWTGMVGQLLNDKADIALAPFQMSAARSSAVDFTKPFMTKGTTVVVRRPEQHIWVFQFLSPLSKVVWSAIFLAFAIVSLVLFGVSRVNSDRKAQYTSNLRESFWYIWGTLLRGSLSGSPFAISSRIVSSAWWFFCLIVTSIYTANLAAFLTITIGDAGIESAADLANQNYYDYGTVEGSQTETFFNHTRMPSYAQMWAYMSTLSPGSRVRRVEDGFKRAREGRYAFIWDTPTIRHEISNDCNLMEVGSSFDNKGYGFAFQKHAPYSERLSWALLKLNDAGILYRLERKWWRPQFCPNQVQSAKTKSLDLETVSGMYLVILGGIVISAILCLAQYCLARGRIKKRRSADDEDEDAKPRNPCMRVKGDGVVKTAGDDLQVFQNHSSLTFRALSPSEWS